MDSKPFARANETEDAVVTLEENEECLSAWQDLGGEINVKGKNYITLYITITRNDAVNMRIRGLAYHTSGGTGFPIGSGQSIVCVATATSGTWEFDYDVSESYIGRYDVQGFNFIKFQCSAGTEGSQDTTMSVYYVAT